MLEGAHRKCDRNFPCAHKQEDFKGDDNIREDMETIKMAELVLWEIEEILVAAFVYNSKPMQHASTKVKSNYLNYE